MYSLEIHTNFLDLRLHKKKDLQLMTCSYKILYTNSFETWRNISSYFTSALSMVSGQVYQLVVLSQEITPVPSNRRDGGPQKR